MKKKKIKLEKFPKSFRFKQFQVIQDENVMKVGTDAVLLGALASIDGGRLLDIGCGTGVISLMLAQRCSTIDQLIGIDIDEKTAEIAKINYTNSPWRNKLRAKHQSLQDFTLNEPSKFDLIVTNPPYYEHGLLPENEYKQLVKHSISLPFLELVKSAADLLTPGGIFSIIIPATAKQKFITLTNGSGFALCRKVEIFSKENSEPTRSILEFRLLREKDFHDEVIEDYLIIYAKSGKYSDEYKALTRAFYLDIDKH